MRLILLFLLLQVKLFSSEPTASPIFYKLAYGYLDACCFSLAGDKFEELLAEDIILDHQTNDEPPFHAEGKALVASLFRKYIFENTSDIKVFRVSFEEENEGILLELEVEENKNNDGQINRYLFHETTRFEFRGNKISRIETMVQRCGL
jgi:hypothetical protein